MHLEIGRITQIKIAESLKKIRKNRSYRGRVKINLVKNLGHQILMKTLKVLSSTWKMKKWVNFSLQISMKINKSQANLQNIFLTLKLEDQTGLFRQRILRTTDIRYQQIYLKQVRRMLSKSLSIFVSSTKMHTIQRYIKMTWIIGRQSNKKTTRNLMQPLFQRNQMTYKNM